MGACDVRNLRKEVIGGVFKLEIAVVIMGCVISFLCGAYVRSPFAIICCTKKRRKSGESELESELDRQWENFWSYDGNEQPENE